MKPTSDTPVTYGAIGATQALDLMTHPPDGFRPLERTQRIGHGADRFAYACDETMSWGIQRLSGFRVERVDEPADEGAERVYTADGEALLVQGETAMLVIPFGPFGITAPARVIYVVDEPKRKGFAYGTLPGHPECGEEAFLVEHREDDSVWIVIRAFSRPSTWFWRLVSPILRLVQEFYTRRYLTALAGSID